MITIDICITISSRHLRPMEVQAVPYKSLGISKSAPGLRHEQDGS